MSCSATLSSSSSSCLNPNDALQKTYILVCLKKISKCWKIIELTPKTTSNSSHVGSLKISFTLKLPNWGPGWTGNTCGYWRCQFSGVASSIWFTDMKSLYITLLNSNLSLCIHSALTSKMCSVGLFFLKSSARCLHLQLVLCCGLTVNTCAAFSALSGSSCSERTLAHQRNVWPVPC